MRGHIETAHFRAAMGVVAGIARKGAIPIIECVMVSLSDGRLTLTATQFDLWGEGWAAADVVEPGETCVSSDLLGRFLSAVTGGLIEISLEGDGLTLKSGGDNITLPCLDARDFPACQDVPADARVISGEENAKALAWCSQASSREEARYYLKGVCHSGNMFVATNGHIANWAPAPEGGGDEIIPAEFIPRICPVIEGGGSIHIGATHWSAVSDGGVISGKLIDGTFPDWRRIIPDEGEPCIGGSAKGFRKALDRATLKCGGIVRISVDGDIVEIENLVSHDKDGHNAKAKVSVEFGTGKGAVFGVNSAYLSAALNLPDDRDFTLQGSGGDPILIRAGDYRSVIMPMRI